MTQRIENRSSQHVRTKKFTSRRSRFPGSEGPASSPMDYLTIWFHDTCTQSPRLFTPPHQSWASQSFAFRRHRKRQRTVPFSARFMTPQEITCPTCPLVEITRPCPWVGLPSAPRPAPRLGLGLPSVSAESLQTDSTA